MLTLRSIGFSDAERRLLVKQLEILNARMSYQWHYKGEGTSGELILAKKPVALPSLSTTLVLVDIKSHPDYLCIDRPIRLMQLSRVLHKTAEKSYSLALNIRAVFAKYQQSDAPLKCGQCEVYFSPQTQTIHYSGDPVAGLIHCIKKNSGGMAGIAQFSEGGIPQHIENTYSYRSVLWLIARKELIFAEHRWNETDSFKISSWPNLRSVYGNRKVKSMALLFSRSFMSVAEVAKAAEINSEQVKLFLHCCDAIGIKIIVSQHNSPLESSPRSSSTKNNPTLIFWLKKKIHSIIRNAN